MFPDTLTSIDLLSGIPWQSDYKHVRYFSSKSEQDSYFNSRTVVKSFDSAKVVRTANQFSMLLTLTPAQANKVSYLKFTNGNLDNKTYYCFVKGISYEADNRCRLFVEIDFYQTFLFDVSFKNSYVERQHGNVTLIEDNLALGQELVTYNISETFPYKDYIFIVIVASENLNGSTGGGWNVTSYAGAPSALYHYVVPIRIGNNANDSSMVYTDTGATFYNWFELFSTMQDTWANKIVSAYITKYCGLNFIVDGNNITYSDKNKVKFFATSNNPAQAMRGMFHIENVKEYDTMTFSLSKAGLPSGFNPKLSQYPYNKVVISTVNGQQLELKPQFIDGDSINIRMYGSLGISNKVAFSVENYALNGVSPSNQKLNCILIDDTPQLLPIIVEQYAAFVQGHANSLMASRRASANDWQTSLKVAERTADTNVTTTGINGLGNTAGGLLSGNPFSALNNATQAMTSTASSMLQGATQMLNAGDIGKNNFENLVNNQQAMLSDLLAVPPNTKSMGGNSFFEFGNFAYPLRATWKTVNSDDGSRITNYFNTFGYKVNKYTSINFNSRSTYNYVKTIDCVVTGDLNQSILDVFKRIFNNGVFLHHTNEITI